MQEVEEFKVHDVTKSLDASVIDSVFIDMNLENDQLITEMLMERDILD